MSKLLKIARKIQSKLLLSKIENKLKKVSQIIPSQEDIINKIKTSTSALLVNSGVGGIQNIRVIPERNPDGSILFKIRITLIDHDKSMPKIGDVLNDKILSILNNTFPNINFAIIFTKDGW